jgi:hypothetical protein
MYRIQIRKAGKKVTTNLFSAPLFAGVGSWMEKKNQDLGKHPESAKLLPSNKLHSYRQASLVGFVHVPK